MVAVIGKEKSLIERGKLYVKLLSVCCHQKNITGIYTSGVVFQPRFYEGFSGMMKEDSLPIYNWIWFGLYRTEKESVVILMAWNVSAKMKWRSLMWMPTRQR